MIEGNDGRLDDSDNRDQGRYLMKRKRGTNLPQLIFIFGVLAACCGGEATIDEEYRTEVFAIAGAPGSGARAGASGAGAPSTIHACQIGSPVSLEGRRCCCNEWCGTMHPWTNPRVPPNYYKCYR
jgi:hypothetical protein